MVKLSLNNKTLKQLHPESKQWTHNIYYGIDYATKTEFTFSACDTNNVEV